MPQCTPFSKNVLIVAAAILIFITVFSSSGISQNTWSKSFGGYGGELVLCIEPTSDQGFIAGGWTDSFGSHELWILKLDSSGIIQWQQTYGGTGTEAANAVLQTTDGNYIVAGYSDSFSSSNLDIWLLKLDPQGSVIWQKTFAGPFDDEAFSVKQTSDNGYIVAGKLGSAAWIAKFDANDNLLWQKVYTKVETTAASAIVQSNDGGFVFAGKQSNSSLWITKVDSNGDVVWSKTIQALPSYRDEARDLVASQDGGYLVCGIKDFDLVNRDNDVWMLKFDSSGNLEWEKAFGSDRDDFVNSCTITATGEYLVGGITGQCGAGCFQGWLSKFDTQGNSIWFKSYANDPINSNTRVQSLRSTVNGEIIIAGEIGSEAFSVSKLDINGDLDSSCNLTGNSIFDSVDPASVVSTIPITAQTPTVNSMASSGISASSLGITLIRCSNDCDFCDYFDDDILDPNWTYMSGVWTENLGALVGNGNKKAMALATPIFAGCINCVLETSMEVTGGLSSKASFLGWYQDKKNTIELLMDEEKDKWILKQRSNGIVTSKQKAFRPINPNQFYSVTIMFEGTAFRILIDGSELFTIAESLPGLPFGVVGFKVKSTTARIDYIRVN
jgi:lactonase family protein with 7-bladed beta-propeller